MDIKLENRQAGPAGEEWKAVITMPWKDLTKLVSEVSRLIDFHPSYSQKGFEVSRELIEKATTE